MTLKILARKRRVFSPPEAADAPSAEPSRSPLRRWSSAGEPLELEDLEDDLSFSGQDCCDVNEVADVGAEGTPLHEGPLTLSSEEEALI
mmetsp:Transcript_11665/g.25644  ORF Transcript_11665/g.25644 Transcript_11665/m.25644 type:complete len:89 (+) Transcript_11665:98-364(+)